MNRIYEVIKPVNVLPPKSQTAGGNDTSVFVDGATGMTIDFLVTFGAVAEGKKVTVELLVSGAKAGTSPASLGSKVVTAPADGADDGTVVLSTQVKGDQPRYYGVKISNNASSPVLVSAVALVAGRHTDEGNDFDVLTV